MVKPDAQTVIDLTGTDLSEPVVTLIIEDAALIAGPCLSGVADDRATSAIKWLAAHLVASTSDGGAATLTSDKLGDASQSWARAQMGDGIVGSTYGQQAVALVPCLARVGRAQASVEVLS